VLFHMPSLQKLGHEGPKLAGITSKHRAQVPHAGLAAAGVYSYASTRYIVTDICQVQPEPTQEGSTLAPVPTQPVCPPCQFLLGIPSSLGVNTFCDDRCRL
jgi:hypothetical protein